MMTTSLAADGMVALVPVLAVMLGALAGSNVITSVAAIALVLGANLGGAIPPVLEVRSTQPLAGRR
jgi:Na+/phosphate symporter